MARLALDHSRTARHINISPPGTIDPVIICCDITGAGMTAEGAPVLCVPGLGDTGRVFRKIIPALAARHRAIAMEPRGHGRSSAPAGKYALDDLAGDIGALAKRLALARPVLIGHGLGARAALLLAIEQPRLPAALILIAAGAAPASKSARRGIAERIHLAQAGEMHEVYRNRKAEGREPRGMSPAERAERHRLFMRNDPAGYASAGYAELLAPDLTERLGEVACPVLALAGALDPEYHEDARTLAEEIPKCESVLIEDAGRYPQLDRAEAALALIHEFFRKHGLAVARGGAESDEQTGDEQTG